MTMHVVKSLFVETGTYDDMVLRPFTSNIDQQTQNVFNEISNGGLNVTPASVASLAGQVLKPSPQPAGLSIIDNGWGIRRLRFLIIVDIETPLSTSRVVVSGYTDYNGGTISGNIDPHLKCYFNSVTSIRTTYVNKGYGRVAEYGIADNSHILARQSNETFTGNVNTNDARRTMRPEDVLSTMSTNSLGSISDTGIMTYDHRTTFLTGPKKSKRTNAVGSVYMSKIMRGMNDAFNDPNIHMMDERLAFETAKGYVREDTLAGDIFFGIVTRETGYQRDGYITYTELCKLLPGLDNATVLVMRGEQRNIHREAQRGDCAQWTGTTLEAVAATILSQAVTGLMLDHMITKVRLTATNRTIDGQPAIHIEEFFSFAENLEMTPYINAFMGRFTMEVVPLVTGFNEQDFAFSISADVVGDTYITVSLNGQPPMEFTTPSFCDALMTPLVTQGSYNLDAMAFNMQALFDESRNYNGLCQGPVGGFEQQLTQPLAQPMQFFQPGYQPMSNQTTQQDIVVPNQWSI